MANMTCGAVGGAIGLWVKVIMCNWSGIISSVGSSTGSTIYCNNGGMRYDTHVLLRFSHKLVLHIKLFINLLV